MVQREKGRDIFRLEPVPTGGTLNLAFQFTDASAHEVTVTAFGPGPEDRTETTRIVHVYSATPSLGIRTRPVVLFLLVVTAGLAAGRISKRRRHPLR